MIAPCVVLSLEFTQRVQDEMLMATDARTLGFQWDGTFMRAACGCRVYERLRGEWITLHEIGVCRVANLIPRMRAKE